MLPPKQPKQPMDWDKLDVDNIQLTGLSQLTEADIKSVYEKMDDNELRSVLDGMQNALATAIDRKAKIDSILKIFMNIGKTAVKGVLPI